MPQPLITLDFLDTPPLPTPAVDATTHAQEPSGQVRVSAATG